MNYVSTRGSASAVPASDAIRLGIAPDGGLFTPETIPKFSLAELQSIAGDNYHDLATKILTQFLSDYPLADLRKMVAAAYAYPAKFDDQQITPVHQLRNQQYLLELWHGPTYAFKDVALQLLPYLITKASVLANDFKEIIILVATSGDTGKAALEGFKNIPGTQIIVFFPDQGVSEIQRLQMVTQEGCNTHVVSVLGNFDDAQNGVKQLFADLELAAKLKREKMAFSSANSINWGRLAPQIVYYFYGYFQLCKAKAIKVGDKMNITVPTGNFGNILAAYFAKHMGLPVQKLICASNSNNVLTDFVNTGCYNRNRVFYNTISPSMDILISSNLERLLFYLCDGNYLLLKEWMSQLKSAGYYQVDNATASKVADEFYAGFAAEQETLAEIKKVFAETKTVIDPHTAVGMAVYERYQQETGDETPVLFASTASPFKFNASVLKALGEKGVTGVSEFTLLERLAKLTGFKIPVNLSELSKRAVCHRTVCQKEEMGTILERILNL